MNRFVPFGLDHWAALATTGFLACVVVALGRRHSATSELRTLRWTLGALLAGLLGGELLLAIQGGWFSMAVLLPLQLCDLAVLLAIFALATRSQRVVDLLYFWAFSGTLLAIVTPDLGRGFPSPEYLVFFGLHGLVVVSTALLTFGLGLVPGPRAWRRAFWLTALYAAGVGGVNWLLDANFLYLCAKPRGATLLDYMGPWPVYIGVAIGIAAALFFLLELPLRRTRLRTLTPG